jgi:predicted RND superfamily exporter protein
MRSSATVGEDVAPAASARRRVVALVVLLALTALLVGSAWSRARLLGPLVRLPPEGEAARVDAELTAEFGTRNPVVWVVAVEEGSVWTHAALEKVRDLTRQAFTVPGVIATEVVSIASPNVRDLRVTAETMEPTYLMADVPSSPAEIDALRQRIESDPKYHGNLVSLDGRAALVVADFRPEADASVIARDALAIRDRLRDERTDVYVAGAPVLRGDVSRVAPRVAAAGAGVVAAAMLVLAVAGSPALLGATLAAGLLALVWAAAPLVVSGFVALPWSAYAIPPVALLASLLVACEAPRSHRLSVAAALGAGFAILAFLTPSPANVFGIAGAAGSAAAAVAAELVRRLAGEHRLSACAGKGPYVPPVLAWTRRTAGSAFYRFTGVPARARHWVGVAATVSVAVATLLGATRFHASFGASGYAERYVPGVVTSDLRSFIRHFPPPTALALRVRGEAGFIKSPAVLEAFDGVTRAARADPAVRQAMSLADVVKLVHRGFNGNEPAYEVIPEDEAMIGRYLALAYSPGFRRFVNRAFTGAAVWVYVSGDRVADLSRVRGEIEAQLRAQPIPGATVDPLAGDGAAVLASAALAFRLMSDGVVVVLAAVLCVAALIGAGAAGRAFLGAVLGGAFTAGAFGLGSVTFDFVSLPFLAGGALGGFLLSSLAAPSSLRVALTVFALAALCASVAGETLLGVVAGAPLLAAVAAAAIARGLGTSVVSRKFVWILGAAKRWEAPEASAAVRERASDSGR